MLGGKIQPEVIKMFTDLENMMKSRARQRKCRHIEAYKETFKLETEGEAATADFLESLGCSDVGKVMRTIACL